MIGETTLVQIEAIQDARALLKKTEERLVSRISARLLYKVVRYTRDNVEYEGKVIDVRTDKVLHCKLHIQKRTKSGFNANAHSVGIEDLIELIKE